MGTERWRDSGRILFSTRWHTFGDTLVKTKALSVPDCPSCVIIDTWRRLVFPWIRRVARNIFPFARSGSANEGTEGPGSRSVSAIDDCSATISIGISISSVSLYVAISGSRIMWFLTLERVETGTASFDTLWKSVFSLSSLSRSLSISLVIAAILFALSFGSDLASFSGPPTMFSRPPPARSTIKPLTNSDFDSAGAAAPDCEEVAGLSLSFFSSSSLSFFPPSPKNDATFFFVDIFFGSSLAVGAADGPGSGVSVSTFSSMRWAGAKACSPVVAPVARCSVVKDNTFPE
mmetsp:Transcript_34767/g.82414  ORF Transcript_34767/g.82414 Transcript_34767/m.82414 type:complete len:290 (-) Transcript_34767:1043-1912(-)